MTHKSHRLKCLRDQACNMNVPGTIFTGFLISCEEILPVLRKRVAEEADLTHIAVRKILICSLTQLFAQLVSCYLFVRVSQCRLCAGFWGVRLGALEVSVSLRYVSLPPVIWPQSPHLVVKGMLKLVSMYLAHTSIPNF